MMDTLVEQYSSRIPAIYEGADGFRGALLLLDRAASRAQSISLWESAAHFEACAARDGAYAEAMTALGARFNGVPELQLWEHAASIPPGGGRGGGDSADVLL